MAGRKQNEYDPEVEGKIADLAFDGCSTRTIAQLLGFDEQWVRKHFNAILAQKRAERRHYLRKRQLDILKGDPKHWATMAIWLGKNELGQADKSEVRQDITAKVYGKQFDLDAVAGKGDGGE